MYDALQANWGEHPSRTVFNSCNEHLPYEDLVKHDNSWEHKTGWCKLGKDEQAYVLACFAGKTLPQVLEGISFYFLVDGVTRAETHQMVRTRIGAGFMQHGGRDNDWRHRDWSMPETLARACDAFADRTAALAHGQFGDTELPYPGDINGRKLCITDWGAIEQWVNHARIMGMVNSDTGTLRESVEAYLRMGKELYSALVDAGIPWQDARRVLHIGTQTYIHAYYTWPSFKGVLANRLEHVMDWEVNCVVQLMQREINMKCPPMFGAHLGSHSDFARRAKFDQLESWPPDGKWPAGTERCGKCGHSASNHRPVVEGRDAMMPLPGETVCEVCERDSREFAPMHVYTPVDSLPRQHTSVQMPYFVLHPDSMQGGPVKWLWTNGRYDDIRKQLEG